MITCVYHDNCNDGAVAAAILKRYFKKHCNVIFFPMKYGQELSSVTMKGEKLYILDFSFSAEIMNLLCQNFDEVILIDHHQSALNRLKDFERSNLTKVIDINKSGSLLTYEYFFGQKDVLYAVLLVNDRDLWKYEYADTNAMYFYLRSLKGNLELIERAVFYADDFIKHLKEGRIIGDYHFLICENLLKAYKPNRNILDNIPLFNVPSEFGSDICNIFLSRSGENVCGYFTIDGDHINIGLRSSSDKHDVSKIAEKHGGGGHKRASGLTLKIGIGIGI